MPEATQPNQQPQKTTINWSKVAIGGVLLGLLSTTYWLDQMFPGEWLSNEMYVLIGGAITTYTGATSKKSGPAKE